MPDDADAAPGAESAAQSDRSFTAFLSDLASETTLLVQQELALFKAELAEKRGRVVSGAILLAAAALISFGGFLALLAAAVLGLAKVIAAWLAALLVGLAALFVGGALFYLGKRRLDARALVLRRTLNSLREDEAWLREQFR